MAVHRSSHAATRRVCLHPCESAARDALHRRHQFDRPTRWQRRRGEGSEFAARYGVHRIVWAERFDDIRDAIAQEKCLKKWRRAWKVELIEASNPQWLDLLADPPLGR